MNLMQVTVTIRNPADPEKSWEGLFMVDPSITDSLVPRHRLEAIGLVPKGRRSYKLAGHSEINMDITTADIEFMDEIAGGTIIFGDNHAEPILGTTALKSAGIEIDALNNRLKKLPAAKLK
ncbi:MAG: clan AA aspartic protease [Gammaproteobacteria bacterium]|nr:clan AA aspartic protease [Gammaproteobacteria bacterium]NNJ83898.1 clan AA aspartic protease [Gammaproteobacteria bacterium]